MLGVRAFRFAVPSPVAPAKLTLLTAEHWRHLSLAPLPVEPIQLNSKAFARVRLQVADEAQAQGIVYPNLGRDDWELMGDFTDRFNCIAHTIGDHTEWHWPGSKRADFDRFYRENGFVPFTDDVRHPHAFSLVAALEKIVLFGDARGDGQHAIVQAPDGSWSSKMGRGPLTRIASPWKLSGGPTGVPLRVYARERNGAPSNPAAQKLGQR